VVGLISPALADALADWLEHCSALDAASENTLKAYQADVMGFLAFMTLHKGAPQGLAPLAKISVSDMRSWMSSERSRGVGARSLARELSAVKSFYRWIAEREDLPLPDTLMITGKGGKDRLVPVIPAARSAVDSYVRLCPHPVEPDAPLFRGVRGGALNPRAVQKVMEKARMQLGLPATATPHAMRHSFATHLLS